MGYCISVTKVSFQIKAQKKVAALQAVKNLKGQETCHDSSGAHFSWVRQKNFEAAKTLEEMLEGWRWRSTCNVDDDIVALEFTGEKMGDDNLLFNALAPFVEGGSEIHFQGEDGSRWRYIFDGKNLKVLYAKNVRTIWVEGDELEEDD